MLFLARRFLRIDQRGLFGKMWQRTVGDGIDDLGNEQCRGSVRSFSEVLYLWTQGDGGSQMEEHVSQIHTECPFHES